MMVSPFTFYRGNAKGMAIDLAASPISGLRVQMCGDAHLSNFGVFASPERRLLFDVNDFDETLPGPWEWDVKRLAASLVVAGRGNGFSRKERRKIVVAAVRRYRDAMAEFAGMPTLDVWYARAEIDEVRAVGRVRLSARRKKNLDKALAKARSSDSLKAFGKLTETVDGQVRIKSDPPLLVPVAELFADQDRAELADEIRGLLNRYRRTLPNDRRALLRPVRVRRPGAQGGRGGQRRDPLLDRADARSRRDRPAVPAGQGGRGLRPEAVCACGDAAAVHAEERRGTGGRRPAADAGRERHLPRLGTASGHRRPARDFYVRQLRDMKGSAEVERMDPTGMTIYGQLCGWTLARAHARSGDPIAISAYLGSDDVFPKAIADFAELYADQNERDHRAFLEGIRDGRLVAEGGL